ncbi:MAG: molybdopterin-dependent oxidoreductase [Planctomycetaceae bacterium]
MRRSCGRRSRCVPQRFTAETRRPGAIGNARWGGVRLADLLKRAGVKENARHVWFEGLDAIPREGGTIPFGGSVPIEKAMSDAGSAPGALVATTMNEQPLTSDHGFPVRTVVPGYIGARSVKWLGKIVVSDRPSPNHYLQRAYKLVTRDDPLEWAEAGPIYKFPLNAAICVPAAGTPLKPGTLQVAGYALPPGEAGVVIERVELSADAGGTWTTAKFKGAQREFCWQLWSADVPIDAATRRLTVRAIDSKGNVQPRHVPWNMKGYLFHAWHDVAIDVEG